MNRENGCDVIEHSIQLFPTKFLFLNSCKFETQSKVIVPECEGKRGPGPVKSERPFRERRMNRPLGWQNFGSKLAFQGR